MAAESHTTTGSRRCTQMTPMLQGAEWRPREMTVPKVLC
jgi:hypothetical protein